MPGLGGAPSDAAKARAEEVLAFIDASPTPYHCAATAARAFAAAGFEPLDESAPWATGTIRPGGKYYLTRHEGTILAFTVGARLDAGGQFAFKLLGAHTDTPVLKVRPRAGRKPAAAHGLVQLGVECYGGGLWHTWLDRDLGVAGRVVVRGADGAFDFRLVRVDRPVVRVPSLCIHLQNADERKALEINKETHLMPVLCAAAAEQLGAKSGAQPATNSSSGAAAAEDAYRGAQPAPLLALLADELGVAPEAIVDLDLTLFDTQRGALAGAFGEFVTSSRLDDQASVAVLTEALVRHATTPGALDADADVTVFAAFDHEEIGSESSHGAGSPVIGDVVERIHRGLRAGAAAPDAAVSDAEHLAAAMRRSILLSIDMAHAVHPNYAAKHEPAHAPHMNKGLVLKVNTNQRYTTDGATGFLVRELARRAGLPALQDFVVRNDCPCGSTIGPILSARFGVRAADMGMPQLSMHSIREMGGVEDLTLAHDFFAHFLKDFRALDDSFAKYPCAMT